MKMLLCVLTIFSAGLLSVQATSVGLSSNHCPVCNKKSHYHELHSFSMFGEPSRDFLDSPIFHFSGPRVCPWDLFASQYNNWEFKDKDEVARMRRRLEKGKVVILLTAEEGKVADEIREAGNKHPLLLLRELWWVRTLQSPMNVEEEIMLTMNLYDSCYGDLSPVPILREGYRRKLLQLFRKGIADKKIDERSRLRYQYLHAEFLRKGGELEEALKEFSVFDKLLGAIPEKERAEHEPIVTWTKEQIMRLQLETVDLESLIAKIKLPLINPFRDKEAEQENDFHDAWLRHRWGLQELVRRCIEGDLEATNQLWDLLERDAGKLLAVVETISFPSLNRFASADPRWEEWRSEMWRQLKEGTIPKGAKVEVNQERNINLLTGVVRGGKAGYLIDAEKEADTPEGRLRAALTIMEKGTKDEAKMSAAEALAELQTLDWKLATEETMFDYPLQYLSKAFALSGERFQIEMEASLTKPWKDPFFREMKRLWLGKPDALAKLEETEALKAKPNYPGYGPAQMVYFYLEARKDPAWRERCVRDLNNLNLLNSRVLRYAEVIMTPALTAILLERHAKLMQLIEKEKGQDNELDLKPMQALDIEELWRNVQLLRLPLEVAK